MKTILALLVVLVIAGAVVLTETAEAGGYGPYYYGYASSYGGYYPSYNYEWYPAGISYGRWFPAGRYAWVNGAWYRYGYGYEFGILLPTAPLTTQILTLPAGLPNTTVLSPAPPAQTIKPPAPAGGGLSAEDIHDLKELLKELRKPQPPTAK